MSNKRLHFSTLVLLFWSATQVLADTATAKPIQLSTPSLTFSIFRMLGALALVIGLFFGAAWLFKNWQRIVVQRGKTPKLNLLEIKSLGPRHALYVIGYEQQRFLLSSSPTGVTMLTHLPQAENETEEPSAPAAPNFSQALFQALGQK